MRRVRFDTAANRKPAATALRNRGHIMNPPVEGQTYPVDLDVAIVAESLARNREQREPERATKPKPWEPESTKALSGHVLVGVRGFEPPTPASRRHKQS